MPFQCFAFMNVVILVILWSILYWTHKKLFKPEEQTYERKDGRQKVFNNKHNKASVTKVWKIFLLLIFFVVIYFIFFNMNIMYKKYFRMKSDMRIQYWEDCFFYLRLKTYFYTNNVLSLEGHDVLDDDPLQYRVHGAFSQHRYF